VQDANPFFITDMTSITGNGGLNFKINGGNKGWVYYSASTNNITISNSGAGTEAHLVVKPSGDVGVNKNLVVGSATVGSLAQLHIVHKNGFPDNQGLAIENSDSHALWHINADNEFDLTLYEGGVFKGQFLRSDGTYAKV